MELESTHNLFLNNTLTKRKELFRSRRPGIVNIFTCGPSIYRRPHIGNYRTFIYEDILVKYLEYLGFTVNRVINFTDIEDKTISTASEEGVDVSQLTQSVEDTIFQEIDKLAIRFPKEIQRSSTSIETAVEIIDQLLANGHAYWHDGNVYFDPLTYDDFGAVYGLDMSRWPKKKVRFSKDTYPGQRWNLGDFILWHGYDGGEWIHWDTKIGKGRPSWNVQDPAMIVQGAGYELDIHCGGIDNLWRHHDYNRAVLESVSGKELAHYWLHGEHLIVGGEKMSKSKGNVLYIEDLINRGCTGQRVRFLLAYGYYREKMNVTDEMMESRCEKILGLQEMIAALTDQQKSDAPENPRARQLVEEIELLFRHEMNNDLHVGAAIDAVDAVLQELKSIDEEKGLSSSLRGTIKESLSRIDEVLGVLFKRED